MEQLINILKTENCSLVLRTSDGTIHRRFGRGISDLYQIYISEPHLLDDADVADKVVGRGAATLMIMGCVKRLHAVVMSQNALSFLNDSAVEFSCDSLVDTIINRRGDGICPVEKLTAEASCVEEATDLIMEFFAKMNNNKLKIYG